MTDFTSADLIGEMLCVHAASDDVSREDGFHKLVREIAVSQGALAHPYLLVEQQLEITASSGITIYPLDDSDPDTLLCHADQAMYLAKHAGRNCYRFFDAIGEQQIHRHQYRLQTIEDALIRSALRLYYQPKVDINTGKVFGVEALIRWNHPERGILPPAEFLSFIAGSSLENRVGHWVIQEALGQLDIWRKSGLNIQISVNVALIYLQSPTFYSELNTALARHPNIESQQLELEVLKYSAMDNLTTVSNVIGDCFNLLGVPFALDDFGTGYSSLTPFAATSLRKGWRPPLHVQVLSNMGCHSAKVMSLLGLCQRMHCQNGYETGNSTRNGSRQIRIQPIFPCCKPSWSNG